MPTVQRASLQFRPLTRGFHPRKKTLTMINQPKKRDLLNFVNNTDDFQRVAKADVAMYIHLSIAAIYADEINETCQKYNLCMGLMKNEYLSLDKAMRRYDHTFRDIITQADTFLRDYDVAQAAVLQFTDDHAAQFTSLYQGIHQLVDDFVNKNVEPDVADIDHINEICKE